MNNAEKLYSINTTMVPARHGFLREAPRVQVYVVRLFFFLHGFYRFFHWSGRPENNYFAWNTLRYCAFCVAAKPNYIIAAIPLDSAAQPIKTCMLSDDEDLLGFFLQNYNISLYVHFK